MRKNISVIKDDRGLPQRILDHVETCEGKKKWNYTWSVRISTLPSISWMKKKKTISTSVLTKWEMWMV